MKELRYIIQDELGIHARPAGLLVKKLREFSCAAKIGRRGEMVDATGIFGVMGLGIKHGEEMIITFDGPDEDNAAVETEKFLREHL